MSFSGDEHSDIQMAKSHRILEFLQEDLELILDHESSALKFLIYLRNPSFFFTAESLCADIKILISFLKKVQETSIDDRQSVAGLLIEMTSVVDQQLDAVDFHRILDDALQSIFMKIYRILPMGFLMALMGSVFMATTTTRIWLIVLMALMGFSIAQIRFLMALRLVKVPWEFVVVMKLLMGEKEFLMSLIAFSMALIGVLMSFVGEQISFFKRSLKIANLVKKIKSVEEEVLDDNSHFAEGGNSSDEISWTQNASLVIEEKIVVGLDAAARELLDKLIGGWKKLEVICITGMAGIGKTTLAYRLYDNPSVVNHFHLRAWTSVSQRYQKRKLLIGILSCILNANDPIFAMSDEDIGEELRKCLKRNKYLIVVDDIWDNKVWDDIKSYFPKDNNYSRILMTTRVEDVALKVNSNTSPPHRLRFLTRDESWDLFKQMVFPDNRLSDELIGIGKQIVSNCKGLPLAIVVMAGFLAKEVRTQECWRKVAKDIGSALNSGSEKFMDIIAVSYEHLTPSLKSCFLYVGSFPEDYEIPVNRLIRSWIAEGFIEHKVGKKLEDVAEDHLVNLINRNLLIATKKRPDGGIKSCYMHDLLRDMCQRKAMEKKFVHPICKCKQIGVHYLPTFSNCQYFHFYNLHFMYEGSVFNKDTLSIYRLLRTLDMRHINLNSFPTVVVKLLHLKYLALRVDRITELPPSIFKLWRLETFILDGDKGGRITLTVDILKMQNLRHFQISQDLVIEDLWELPFRETYRNTNQSLKKNQVIFRTSLGNLQTISQLCPSGSIRNLLERTPNLRKLGFHLTLSQRNESFSFPNLSGLNQLEALNFEYRTLGMMPLSIPHPKMFPPSLKKLTLIGSHVNWKEMSTIGSLPNLEVLKIKDNFFSGPEWKTNDEGFRSLKFLKLAHMNLRTWISSSSHFPRLEWLVINGCLDLEVIPSEMGDVSTLLKIEVYQSSDSAVESARQIQDSQRDLGNDDFKVFIYQHFSEFQEAVTFW